MSDRENPLRELFGAPGLLSLSRVGMAVYFPCIVDRPWVALGLMGAAGVSDVLDGQVARRTGHSSSLGAALDAVADKIFALSVLFSLLWSGRLAPMWAGLLCVRELAQVPLLLWLWLVPRARKVGAAELKANWLGKLTTVLQFGALCALLLDFPTYTWFVVATAVTGALAAGSYWKRFSLPLWRTVRRPRGGQGGADNGLAAGQHPR